MSQNNLILHGHFYQPPRENPWTGFVDRQQSAYPYNDWNIRINTECYAACTRTPVFENDEIIKIINCFEYLSFNIGPTLLSWMEKQDADPRTLHKIIEGDKISVYRNNGHGNAIAQVYSHMIMPLATNKDQYTQILWGLKDFRMRFGRDSEGIWLSETAINNETASILVDCGIKFVILSPYQAEKIISKEQTINVLGGKIDSTKPYYLNTKNGKLAIFFYDPLLASEISFGTLLEDSNRLLNTIKEEFNKQNKSTKLVHTATDGEVYGHHKSYGNMSLARVIYDVTKDTNSEISFTNYGKFLVENPPQEECELYLGDCGEGSSWSCAHGVGRWIRDCGCHTGGGENWNQKWREPLRKTFDLLRDELYKNVEKHSSDLIVDIWEARNDYFIPLIQKTQESYEHFFTKHQKKILSELEKSKVLQMMESLRYAMLMYTSCGWFFSDISGIETIQDILYAVRSYEFAKDILDPQTSVKCRNILSQSYSNIKSEGNGATILDLSVNKYRIYKEDFITYICWLVIHEGVEATVQGTNEFIYNIIWQDEISKRYILNFTNYMGISDTIAFQYYNDDSTNKLLWRKIVIVNNLEFEDQNFWTNINNTWLTSMLSSLPLYLRIRFIARSIQFEIERKKYKNFDENALFLNAVWGAESFLLPYEKRVLVFYYASNIYNFAQNMIHQDNLKDIELFIKEAELLKKSASSKEEAVLFLEPIAIALEKYLLKTFEMKDSNMLKNARIIFWSIKDNINVVELDIIRDIMYYFNIVNLEYNKDVTFLIEFNILMKDMRFYNV